MTTPNQGTDVKVRVSGELGMAALLGDVRAFHEAAGVPVLAAPGFPDEDRVALRTSLLAEEFHEYATAIVQGDIVEAADALADIVYVAIGAALEFGIPLDRVWAEVQRSNMAKIDPATGFVVRREDGKILKPEGWTPPDVAAALGLTIT
jgi:predicted HAD superfamily Cof-like phosphohydrolase